MIHNFFTGFRATFFNGLYVLREMYAQVWVNWNFYRCLLSVRGALHRAEGKIRNMNETTAELINFGKSIQRY